MFENLRIELRRSTRITLPGIVLLGSAAVALAERPALINTRIATPFGGNGHSSTIDGRIFISNVSEDHATTTTIWHARVFRPESMTYDSSGKPDFGSAFSTGRTLSVRGGENALAFCFVNAAEPYKISGGLAVYQPYLFDSQMFNGPNTFRRRTSDIRVVRPFTTDADISSFNTGSTEPLTTVSGVAIMGIEPTMTSDGRLMIFQGGPANDGAIDHLMYSYNSTPCAASGWSNPRPLSMMFNDTTAGLKRYPLSWQRLKAANGDAFGDTTARDLIRAAYAWVDHEGRNVLYASVPYTDGARREAMSIIGADTGWVNYHIDGSINTDRYDQPHLFYSGPMWNFEQERSPAQNFPPGANNDSHYLPATKTHDVLALFGSNTNDYNEVDLGEVRNPFYLLFLPMNELVTRAGGYDLARTPDLSGSFFTATLTGSASISAGNAITQSASGSLWQPHGKGKALVLSGGAALVNLVDASGTRPGIGAALRGFTLQLLVRPDADINRGCGGNPYRYLLQKANGIDLIYEADNTVQLSMQLNGRRLRLGRSPALPTGEWTHLAYTWDGETGAFAEYVNGASTGRTLPVERGTFKLGTGTLSIGAGVVLNRDVCPSSGEGSFRGAIDEVQMFTQARSNRSVCLTSHGVSCKSGAIKESPSGGQFRLTQQHPLCNSSAALATLPCATALHRVCAQRGAIDALRTSTNLLETIKQLISNRPPIALLGVPAAVSGTDATVACGPISNESLAVTFEELARRHDGCSDDRTAMTTACSAATHRFCNELGWSSGQIFEMTSRPWVGCFNAGLIEDVSKDRLGPASNAGRWNSTDSNLEISRHCQSRGYGAGIIQELGGGTVAHIHCFTPASTTSWSFAP